MAEIYKDFVRNRRIAWTNETPFVISVQNPNLKPKECLSTANYSVVWRCYDRETSMSVAVKRYNERCADMWAAEMNAMQTMPFPHVNIIQYLDADRKFLTLTMQYVRGGDMRSYVHEKGGLTGVTYSAVALQMCEAMRYIHHLGLVHCDLKLENWLYDAKRERPILTDFGLSRQVEPGELLVPDGSGTAIYQPIELLTQTAYDPLPADVWALAVCLREIAGDLTFEKAIESEETEYGLLLCYANIHDEYSDELWCLSLNPVPMLRPTAECMAQVFRESPWQRWTPPGLPLNA